MDPYGAPGGCGFDHPRSLACLTATAAAEGGTLGSCAARKRPADTRPADAFSNLTSMAAVEVAEQHQAVAARS